MQASTQAVIKGIWDGLAILSFLVNLLILFFLLTGGYFIIHRQDTYTISFPGDNVVLTKIK